LRRFPYYDKTTDFSLKCFDDIKRMRKKLEKSRGSSHHASQSDIDNNDEVESNESEIDQMHRQEHCNRSFKQMLEYLSRKHNFKHNFIKQPESNRSNKSFQVPGFLEKLQSKATERSLQTKRLSNAERKLRFKSHKHSVDVSQSMNEANQKKLELIDNTIKA